MLLHLYLDCQNCKTGLERRPVQESQLESEVKQVYLETIIRNLQRMVGEVP